MLKRWLIVVIILLGYAQPAAALTNYIYPLSSWHVNTHHGEEIGDSYYHMGLDAGGELPAGTPVYAVADGIVREARTRTQFGLVVLIEHFPEAENPNVSLYGHLDPDVVMVEPGETVTAGTQIGVLGDEAENGGWAVHLHFGIHKSAYTGDWVYYGHVHDQAIADDWYDPETYIPSHLQTDTWNPTITWDITDQQIIGNDLTITANPRDIGSRLAYFRLRVSADAGATWTTVYDVTDPIGTYTISPSLNNYSDGPIQFKAIARDYLGNKTTKTVEVIKDPNRFTQLAFLSMQAKPSSGKITGWSFTGSALTQFSPFREAWRHSGDIAVGNVMGKTKPEVATVRGNRKTATTVKIFSSTGELKDQFTAFTTGQAKLTTAQLTGDVTEEIIVASSKADHGKVVAFAEDHTVLWEAQPFGDYPIIVDVAGGDVTGDGIAEIVACMQAGTDRVTHVAVLDATGVVLKKFRPFGSKFYGGCNVAVGDVTGDTIGDIIVGSQSNRSGEVRVYSNTGEQLLKDVLPFGESFKGSIDVSAMQWDSEAGAQEFMVTQASAGQAWVKVYRYDEARTVVFEQLIDDPDFKHGARIVGWNK